MSHLYFPLFFDLQNVDIYFIGGGSIAQRRIETLLPFAGSIRVTAPDITPKLTQLVKEGRIIYSKKPFDPSDLPSPKAESSQPISQLVFACTNDCELNSAIVNLCRSKGIPVNNCSDHHQCDFLFPGIVHKDSIVVGITASGSDHRRVRSIRAQIEETIF